MFAFHVASTLAARFWISKSHGRPHRATSQFWRAYWRSEVASKRAEVLSCGAWFEMRPLRARIAGIVTSAAAAAVGMVAMYVRLYGDVTAAARQVGGKP